MKLLKLLKLLITREGETIPRIFISNIHSATPNLQPCISIVAIYLTNTHHHIYILDRTLDTQAGARGFSVFNNEEEEEKEQPPPKVAKKMNRHLCIKFKV